MGFCQRSREPFHNGRPRAPVRLETGVQYQSRTPTQNPNWCIINRGNVRSPIKLITVPPPPTMFLGPGIEPCDVRARPNAPTN
jgi:hypothetical protein